MALFLYKISAKPAWWSEWPLEGQYEFQFPDAARREVYEAAAFDLAHKALYAGRIRSGPFIRRDARAMVWSLQNGMVDTFFATTDPEVEGKFLIGSDDNGRVWYPLRRERERKPGPKHTPGYKPEREGIDDNKAPDLVQRAKLKRFLTNCRRYEAKEDEPCAAVILRVSANGANTGHSEQRRLPNEPDDFHGQLQP